MNEQLKLQIEYKNQQIIDAIIEKAEKVCPNSLALIGIYGSFSTGDIHEKSDLDLLILINDNNGWKLGTTFLCDGIGYDIYCTTWELLELDSQYISSHISKLMDSKIVYVKNDDYKKRFDMLRLKVKKILNSPFNSTDFQKGLNIFDSALKSYSKLMISDNIREARYYTGIIVYEIENCICMVNKSYFKLGVKRTYSELNNLETKPSNILKLLDQTINSIKLESLKENATELIKTVQNYLDKLKQAVTSKNAVDISNLKGTYEEIYSNWRNKMFYAAEHKDTHLAFMTMISAQEMYDDLYENYNIYHYDVIASYNPTNLLSSAMYFDKVLEQYRNEYIKLGLKVTEYKNINEFKIDYCKNNI